MITSPILVLGKISAARGVNGAIRIIKRGSLLDHLKKLKKKSEIELYSAKAIRDGFLMEPQFHGRYPLLNLDPLAMETAQLKLEGIDTVQEATDLKGLFIGMSLEEARLNFHDPEDPYLFEYIDLEIYEGNELRGKVLRVEEFNGKQWLILNNEAMIPLQGPYIRKVDFQLSRILLGENTGLFESNENP